MTALAKKICLLTCTTALLLCLGSCAQKVSFMTSSVVPAARGDVKISKDNNNNFVVRIQLFNLAEPSRLQPAKSMYVVWVETTDHNAKNIGQIKTSSKFLSSALKSSFQSMSSLKPTKIFLTAEDDAGVQFPSSQIVLSTENF